MEVYLMNFYSYLKDISKNEHYLIRYTKFINFCRNQNINSNYTEKHHILPVSLFPEFKKDQNNIVLLSARQHFLAHWMLAKLTNSPKMWFAFNQMRRIGINSVLYEYARKEISKVISQSNTGKVRSSEHIDAIKRSLKGKRPAKNIETGFITWEDKTDPRWGSGLLVSPRQGYKHSEKTKNKIKYSHKGKKLYQNHKGTIKMFYPEAVPPGYFLYDNPLWHESNVLNSKWYYNPENNTNIRVLENHVPPTGFIKGRSKHTGFDNINKSSKRKYVDLYEKKYVFLDPTNFDQKKHVRYDGQSPNNILVLLYNNFVVLGKKHILKFLESQSVYITYEELKTGIIKKPHHNNNINTLNFRKEHCSMRLTDVGIKLYKLEDFQMTPKYIIKENA